MPSLCHCLLYFELSLVKSRGGELRRKQFSIQFNAIRINSVRINSIQFNSIMLACCLQYSTVRFQWVFNGTVRSRVSRWCVDGCLFVDVLVALRCFHLIWFAFLSCYSCRLLYGRAIDNDWHQEHGQVVIQWVRRESKVFYMSIIEHAELSIALSCLCAVLVQF